MQSGGGEWRGEHSGAYHSYRSDSRRSDTTNIQQFLHYSPDCMQFYHEGQQSVTMQEDQQRRTRLLFDQKRLADADQQRRRGIYPPRALPMVALDRMRVTLCIEVSGSEQLVATRSVSTGMAALLKESKALLRLPEREPSNVLYVNQVTITGTLHEVEHVRQRIREMGTISVTIPLQKSNMNLSHARDWLDCARRDGTLPFPSLVFSLRRTTPMLDIVGAATEEGSIIQAVNVLLNKLYKPEEIPDAQVFTVIEFAAAHREILVGKPEGTVLVAISKETRATVHFPTGVPFNCRQKCLAVICSGKVDAILAARRMILGLLPVQLCLDMESMDMRESMLSDEHRSKHYYVREHNVSIRMEKSDLEPTRRLPTEPFRHFVAICTSEYNIEQMYAIGARFLNMAPPHVLPCPVISPDIQMKLSRCIGPIYAPSRIHSRDVFRVGDEASCHSNQSINQVPSSIHNSHHSHSSLNQSISSSTFGCTSNPTNVTSHISVPPPPPPPPNPPPPSSSSLVGHESVVHPPSIHPSSHPHSSHHIHNSPSPSLSTLHNHHPHHSHFVHLNPQSSNSSSHHSHNRDIIDGVGGGIDDRRTLSTLSTSYPCNGSSTSFSGDQSLDESTVSSTTRISNPSINVYNLPPSPHVHSDGGERLSVISEVGENSHDKKVVMECRNRGRDTPKHTLELIPKCERNDKQHPIRKTIHVDELDMDRDELTMKEGREWRNERRDVKTSYAQVLQQKTTGRMDPLKLIELAGEEKESGGRDEIPTTYASVTRSRDTTSRDEVDDHQHDNSSSIQSPSISSSPSLVHPSSNLSFDNSFTIPSTISS